MAGHSKSAALGKIRSGAQIAVVKPKRSGVHIAKPKLKNGA